MGIYFSKIRTLLEVKRKIDGQEEDLDEDKENNEPDGAEQEDNQDSNENNEDDEHQTDNSASDYSMDVEDEPEDNQEGDGEQEEESSTDNDTETTEGEEETDTDNSASDYSMDVEDDDTEDSSEDIGAEEAGDDNSDSDDTGEDSGDEGSDELKSLENDIFQDISPEQMNIKILELKKQYLEVYSTIVDVLTRTNKIPKTTQNIKVLEFIINKLMELKDLVQFYLSNTFDTKTYMENMVNYQQYLVALNTINRLLKEINVKKGK